MPLPEGPGDVLSKGQLDIYNQAQGGLFRKPDDKDPGEEELRAGLIKESKIAPKKAPTEDDVLKLTAASGMGFLLLNNTIRNTLGPVGDGEGFLSGLMDSIKGPLAGLASAFFTTTGLGLLAGGIFKGVMDGIIGAGKAEEWGVRPVSGAMAKFLAGDGENWRANAGRWAAMVGGAGLLFGGPLGLIAGGLLGAAIGAIFGQMDPKELAGKLDGFFDGFLEWVRTDSGLLTVGIAGGAVLGMKFGIPGMVAGAMLGAVVSQVFRHLQAGVEPGDIIDEMLADSSFTTGMGLAGGAYIGFKIGRKAGIKGALIGALIGSVTLGAVASLLSIKEQTDMDVGLDESITKELSEAHTKDIERLNKEMGKTLRERIPGGSARHAERIRPLLEESETLVEELNNELGLQYYRVVGDQILSLREAVSYVQMAPAKPSIRGQFSDEDWATIESMKQSFRNIEPSSLPSADYLDLQNEIEEAISVNDGIFSLSDSLNKGSLFGDTNVDFHKDDELYVMASTNPSRDALSQKIDNLEGAIKILAKAVTDYKPETNNITAAIENSTLSLKQVLAKDYV